MKNHDARIKSSRNHRDYRLAHAETIVLISRLRNAKNVKYNRAIIATIRAIAQNYRADSSARIKFNRAKLCAREKRAKITALIASLAKNRRLFEKLGRKIPLAGIAEDRNDHFAPVFGLGGDLCGGVNIRAA